MEDKGGQEHGGSSNNSKNPISESPVSPPSAYPEFSSNPSAADHGESAVSFNQSEIFRAVQVVERDSLAIAESFVSLFASLRLALSEVTGRSVDHMQCFCDATGRLQESVLEATTKGNRYINSCLRLNEEMKSIDEKFYGGMWMLWTQLLTSFFILHNYRIQSTPVFCVCCSDSDPLPICLLDCLGNILISTARFIQHGEIGIQNANIFHHLIDLMV